MRDPLARRAPALRGPGPIRDPSHGRARAARTCRRDPSVTGGRGIRSRGGWDGGPTRLLRYPIVPARSGPPGRAIPGPDSLASLSLLLLAHIKTGVAQHVSSLPGAEVSMLFCRTMTRPCCRCRRPPRGGRGECERGHRLPLQPAVEGACGAIRQHRTLPHPGSLRVPCRHTLRGRGRSLPPLPTPPIRVGCDRQRAPVRGAPRHGGAKARGAALDPAPPGPAVRRSGAAAVRQRRATRAASPKRAAAAAAGGYAGRRGIRQPDAAGAAASAPPGRTGRHRPDASPSRRLGWRKSSWCPTRPRLGRVCRGGAGPTRFRPEGRPRRAGGYQPRRAARNGSSRPSGPGAAVTRTELTGSAEFQPQGSETLPATSPME